MSLIKTTNRSKLKTDPCGTPLITYVHSEKHPRCFLFDNQFSIHINISSCLAVIRTLELGRYRFFKSVSVFVILVGFFKSRCRFRYRFFKISRYRFRFSVFPHEPTIAYRITRSLTPYTPSPFSRMGFWPSNLHYKLRP